MADRDLLRRVYEARRRPLLLYAYALCGSREEAEDLVQSAFLKALLSYRATGSLDHWLVKVLRNEFLNQRRDRSRRGEEDLPEHLADPSPTLPEQLIADEEKRRLYAAIARLPVLQRSILLDSVYFGLTDARSPTPTTLPVKTSVSSGPGPSAASGKSWERRNHHDTA